MKRRGGTGVDVGVGRPLWEFSPDEPDQHLGIAISGGGVRSAAFGLGALQAMQRTEWLRRARYLSAVSGGSYVAAAFVAACHFSEETAVGKPFSPLWSPGSPEQTYLAKNLGYLARGLSGRIWFAVNYTFGMAMNLLPLLCGSFIIGRLLGLLVYGWMHHDLAAGHLDSDQVAQCVGVSVVIAMVAVGWVGLRRIRVGGYDSHRDGLDRSKVVTTLGFVAVLLIVLSTVVPVRGDHRQPGARSERHDRRRSSGTRLDGLPIAGRRRARARRPAPGRRVHHVPAPAGAEASRSRALWHRRVDDPVDTVPARRGDDRGPGLEPAPGPGRDRRGHGCAVAVRLRHPQPSLLDAPLLSGALVRGLLHQAAQQPFEGQPRRRVDDDLRHDPARRTNPPVTVWTADRWPAGVPRTAHRRRRERHRPQRRVRFRCRAVRVLADVVRLPHGGLVEDRRPRRHSP